MAFAADWRCSPLMLLTTYNPPTARKTPTNANGLLLLMIEKFIRDSC